MDKELESELNRISGHLKCERCEQTRELGNVGMHMKSGWPTCHGLTMTWITQKQLDKEVLACENATPAATES